MFQYYDAKDALEAFSKHTANTSNITGTHYFVGPQNEKFAVGVINDVNQFHVVLNEFVDPPRIVKLGVPFRLSYMATITFWSGNYHTSYKFNGSIEITNPGGTDVWGDIYKELPFEACNTDYCRQGVIKGIYVDMSEKCIFAL